MLLGLLVVLACVVAGGTYYGLTVLADRENQYFVAARKAYMNQEYASAAGQFRYLRDEFPRSEAQAFYAFMLELCELRDQVHTAAVVPRDALAVARSFVESQKDAPFLDDHRNDLHDIFQTLATQLARAAKSDMTGELLNDSRSALAELRRFRGPGRQSSEQEIEGLLAEAEKAIAQHRHRQRFLESLNRLAQTVRPTVDTVREARELAMSEGYADDSETKRLIASIDESVRKLVRWVPAQSTNRSVAPEAPEPSILVAPILGGRNASAPLGKRVILALVRGVLYALDQNTGSIRWAMRVGIDTTTLPVRLPPTPVSPELFLVLSAERNTLMALAAQDGHVHWQLQLSAPSLGRPVLVDRRMYVPTFDGRVYEIEIAGGTCLGHFELGQVLTVGGVWQEGTDFLYFPADSENLYVLDIARPQPNQPAREKRCVTILRTGHPSGSLRSEPIIVNRIDPYARTAENQAAYPPYLILSQADGLDYMKLRVYELPIGRPDAQPVLQPEPRVRGWSWFQPYFDTEKLAFATDAGAVALFGINQVRNDDKPLFPETPEAPRGEEPVGRLGRAQVVHAVEDNYWVLVNGELQLQHHDVFNQQMIRLWGPLALGSPLHASQLDDAGKVLFLVTQDMSRHAALATAVAAENGKILWQRQLGLDCQGEPVAAGSNVFLADHSGTILRFDGLRDARPRESDWRVVEPVLPRPLDQALRSTTLISDEAMSRLYAVSLDERATKLIISNLGTPTASQPAEGENRVIELPVPLAGAPVISAAGVLVPLSDGTIRKYSLVQDGGQGAGGPNWRSSRADDNASGYLCLLGPDEFLVSDGSRGLTHYQWFKDQPFQTVPPNREPTIELPARIVSAPLLLPPAKPNAEFEICVADSDNVLHLLLGNELKPLRTWRLPGKLTEGPFLRGRKLACIVEGRRLVWIDPAREAVEWTYEVDGTGIVGRPQVISNFVVVADISGRIVALDQATGRSGGKGYQLLVRAAPAATPARFGDKGILIPLTDGTAFILDRQLLQIP